MAFPTCTSSNLSGLKLSGFLSELGHFSDCLAAVSDQQFHPRWADSKRKWLWISLRRYNMALQLLIREYYLRLCHLLFVKSSTWRTNTYILQSIYSSTFLQNHPKFKSQQRLSPSAQQRSVSFQLMRDCFHKLCLVIVPLACTGRFHIKVFYYLLPNSVTGRVAKNIVSVKCLLSE